MVPARVNSAEVIMKKWRKKDIIKQVRANMEERRTALAGDSTQQW